MPAAETVRWVQGHWLLMSWRRLSCREETVQAETRFDIRSESGTVSSGGVKPNFSFQSGQTDITAYLLTGCPWI